MSGARWLAEDDADWEVRPEPLRVVAVGDLHGDVRALGAITRACGLVDERERGRLSALTLLNGVLRTVYARDRADGDALLAREAKEAARPAGFLRRVLTAIARSIGGSRSG